MLVAEILKSKGETVFAIAPDTPPDRCVPRTGFASGRRPDGL